VGKNFGDQVAGHVNDASEEERRRLDEFLKGKDVVMFDGEGRKEGYGVEGRLSPRSPGMTPDLTTTDREVFFIGTVALSTGAGVGLS
jgi:hypothetical protein